MSKKFYVLHLHALKLGDPERALRVRVRDSGAPSVPRVEFYTICRLDVAERERNGCDARDAIDTDTLR